MPEPFRSDDPGSTRRISYSKVVWVGAACVFCLAGCRNVHADECEAFVYTVNTRLAEIDRASTAASQADAAKSGDMRRLAELYERLADKVKVQKISSTELANLRDQYRTMVLDSARLATDIASALDAKNLESAMKAHEQFGAVVSREDDLVSRVNAYCRKER